MRDEKMRAVVVRNTFAIKMYKTPGSRSIFGSWDVEKLHAVVAQSIFPSQNVQNTSASDHFWKLRCRKSARRCGARHISKSKCTKHTTFGQHLEVATSKKCTPLWREGHFQVKMYKTPGFRTTFGAKDMSKSKCAKHQGFGPLLEAQMSLRFASLQYTTLHYTTLHSTAIHNITLHCTPQHFNYNNATTLHYSKLHYTTLHYTTLHYTTLPSTTLDYITLHYTTLHYTPLHYDYDYTPTLHYTKLHYITLHYTTLHYTTSHYTTLHNTTTTTTKLNSTTLH